MPISHISHKLSSSGGRKPFIEVQSYEEAVQLHEEYQSRRNNYPPNAQRAMDILATAGIVTSAQLHRLLPVSYRTLGVYQRRGYILSSAYPTRLKTFSMQTASRNRLWTLGLVGIARAVSLKLSATKFRGYPYKKTIHDVLLNEIVVELLAQAAVKNISHTWYGTYEGRVRDPQNNVLVEPDAMLSFGTENRRQGYAIEYHNEDDRRRVIDKIERYEGVQRSDHWRRYWDVSDMPTIVVAVTSSVVLQGYIDALRERGHAEIRCQYVGKSFGRFAENRAEATVWTNLNKIAFENKREPVRLF